MTTDSTQYAVVIDDEPEMRGLNKLVLMQLGLEVVLTSNAHDGIEAVRQFDPVVTFLDVTMPGMDGFAAAARIRQFSNTYLLLVSGLSDEIDVVQGLAAGADDYVFKPYRPREVRARVEAMMRRPRALAAQPPAATPPVQSELWRPGQAGPDAVTPVRAPAHHEPRTPVAVGVGAAQPVAPPPAARPEVHPVATATVEMAPATTVGPAVPSDLPPTAVKSAGAPAGRPHDPPQGRLPSRLTGLVGGRPASSTLANAPAAAQQVEEPHFPAVSGTAVPHLVGVPSEQQESEWLHHGTLALDPSRCVVLADGEEIELSPSEFALLAALVESGTRVRSTANLVLALRGESYVTTYYVNEADKSAVRGHMSSLLRRLGDTGTTPRWIESVRGVGYRMTGI